MGISRRDFGVGVTSLSLLGAAPLGSGRPKRLLVLGGTGFLGPAVVGTALARGHNVTLFNRGKTNPGLFPSLEKIRGDRDLKSQDLSALEGPRRWDAVIDVWPSDPRISEATATLLKDRIDRYVYVSSVVAYKDLAKIGANEGDALFDDGSNKDSWYEFDKAESERRLQSIFGPRYSSVRPPVIVGWRSEGDAFRFWAARIARGGDVLAPGDGTDPVQFTDVKDIGDFVVAIAERNLPGAFNVVGPKPSKLSFREFLTELNRASGGNANLVWADRDFLTSHGVRAWAELPLWRPLVGARSPGFMQIDSSKAIAAGLTFRPIASTVTDELRWLRETKPVDYEFGTDPNHPGIPRKGFSRAKERELLEAWRTRQS